MRNRTLLIAALSATILVLVSVLGVSAQKPKPIVLKWATPLPKTHPMVLPNIAWQDKITKETNGRLQFKYYHSGTLIGPRETYSELESGVADGSALFAAYSPHGFEIHKAIAPWMYGIPDDHKRTEIYRKITSKFPEIDAEWTGVKILRLSTGSAYQLISVKPVHTIDDLKGLSIKVMGQYVDFIKKCGGEGIPLPMSETFISLQKGVIDGLLAPVETLKTFKFAEVAKYVTILNLTSTTYPGEGMNWDSWNSLPPDIQKTISDSEEWWLSEYIRVQKSKDDDGIEFAKKMGVEFIELSPKELNRFYDVIKEVCLESAKKLDADGYPGTEMFEEMRRLAE